MAVARSCRRTIRPWDVAYVFHTWYVTYVSTEAQAPNGGEEQIRVTFLASRQLAHRYREIAQEDERTLSQSLRLHMAEVVADHTEAEAA